MLYCREYFDDDELQTFYGHTPDNTSGIPLRFLRRTQEGYFRALQKHSPLTGEYLEIGPDLGLLLEATVSRGAFEKFWLFEPNETVKPALEKIVEGRDHHVFTAMFDFNSLPDHRISAAALIHVLDHLVDPKSILEELKTKLAESAIVLIVTHDERSLLARLTGSRWPPYCLPHPMLFNPASIRGLLESAGFAVLDIMKTFNHFPSLYLLKHLLWAVGLKRLSSFNVMGPAVPVKLGNILTIATPARR